MERRYIDRRMLEIQRDIEEAEKRGDESVVDALSSEKLDLRRMLSTMK